MVLAELDDTFIKGTINGVVSTHAGKVAEGDADYEEYINAIKSALDDVDAADKDKNSDRNN